MRISDWSSDVCSSDLAPQNRLCAPPIMTITTLPTQPKVGMVSLGCPKALVDSERILTKLRAAGYGLSPDYAGADVVPVTTCRSLASATDKSLEPLGAAMAEHGRAPAPGSLANE